MTKEYAYRFVIKSKEGQHSHVWRIWTRKNDCYFGIRGTVDQYKISFHESGSCHSGLSRKVRKSLIDDPKWIGKSRHYDEWIAETSLPDTGYVKLFELIIPYSQLDDFNLSNTNKAEWLLCEKGKAASVSVYKINIKEVDKLEFSGSSKEISRLPLENGYYIILVFSLIEEKQEYINIICNTIKHSYENRNNNISKSYKRFDFTDIRPEVRIIVYYKQGDNTYCFEGSVLKNIYTLSR